jgi:hypothetical protein
MSMIPVNSSSIRPVDYKGGTLFNSLFTKSNNFFL